MTEIEFVITGLAIVTFGIRVVGFYIGARLPQEGRWSRILGALPGCLITALLVVLIMQGNINELAAAAVALIVAFTTRNLLITMAAGILTIFVIRNYTTILM